MTRQILKFGIIGTLAAAIHMGVVVLLVRYSLHPLFANIFGFLLAFNVSYLGHRFWTFENKTKLSHAASATRFWGIAVTSFILNETLYYLLLNYTSLNYLPALLLVLLLVTPITFLLSRLWAFSG